jgi:hypothetical protein
MAKIEISFIGPSGLPCSGTLERLADGFYRQAYAEVFVSAPAFGAKAFPLVEGANNNLGSYRQTLIGDTWNDGLYNLRVHNTANVNQVIGNNIFAVRAGTEISIGYEGNVLDVYHADIQFTRNTTTNVDEYTVTWFKNGVRILTGITVPTIQVIKRADGTDLIPAGTAMTQIGTTGNYKYDATLSQKQVFGDTYIVVATMTYTSLVHTYSWNIGRDVQ